jgi:hypothetical protein
MKVRALCAAGLSLAAIAPATAAARNSIQNRLHRADVALNKAQDAADDGNDAGVVSGLKGANRQTALALTSALRLVAHDRDSADEALVDTTDQLDANAQAAMDLLGGASSTVVDAVNTTLVAADTGRGRVLTTIQGLGDLEIDWADALTQITDDIANELSTAGDDLDAGDLSNGGEDALTAYVSQETDAAGAIVTEIGKIAAEADADLDGDALDTLDSDVADASDALDGVSGLSAPNTSAIADVVTKLGDLDDAVGQLANAVNGAYDDEYADDSGDDYGDYADGYSDGYFDGFADWAWARHGHGYHGWNDDGFRPHG